MTLLQLEYFTALAENLHFTRTAEMLHISQPALSYEIAEMEKELGVKLFITEKRKVRLSDYGATFLPYAKKSLSTIERGKNAISEKLDSAAKTVRLGYFHSIGASLIPELISGYNSVHPDSGTEFSFMELRAVDIPDRIRAGEIDLGFYPVASAEENFRGVVEGEVASLQHLYLVVPANHAFSSRKTVDISELENEPLIMLDRKTHIRKLVEECFRQNDMIPLTAMEVPECNTALQYASFGKGISILPPIPGMHSEKIVTVPLTARNRILMRKVLMLTSDSPSPAVREFQEYIRSRKEKTEGPSAHGDETEKF